MLDGYTSTPAVALKTVSEGGIGWFAGYALASVSGIMNPIVGAALIGLLGILLRLVFEWYWRAKASENQALKEENAKLTQDLEAYRRVAGDKHES